MNATVKKILKPFASLYLTVALLFMSMVLVYAGTSAQKETGIWEVQHWYFHSFHCYIPFKYLLPLSDWWWKHASIHVLGGHAIDGFPFVGGYTLIGLLLINLLAAHSVRFKFAWKRSGILMIHFGLILLLVSEVMTSLLANEAIMSLNNGDSQHYAEDIRDVELAVVDPSSADHDTVVSVASSRLKTGGLIHDARLPFDLRVDAYYPNAVVQGPQQMAMSPGQAKALATAGPNRTVGLIEQPPFSGVGEEAERTNTPGAFVTPVGNGQPLGTYMLTSDPSSNFAGFMLTAGQPVPFDGKTYLLQLRFKRVYKPYSIKLIKFTHESFVGTDMAKNFASKIELVDPANGVDRELLVWMNHPLRYRNDTIYQQKFNRMVGGDEGTVLQIVNNTNWFMPYVAVVIGGLGLVIHFGMMLVIFLRKRSAANAKAAAQLAPPKKVKNASRDGYTLQPSFRWKTLVPAVAIVLTLIVIACCFVAALLTTTTDSFDLDALAKTAVHDEGRTMPFDSLARNYLKIIHGRQEFEVPIDGNKDKTETVQAVKWLTDVLTRPDVAATYPVFRVDNEDIKGMLGLKEAEKYFSWKELFYDHPENPDKLQKQYDQAKAVLEKDRDAYQAKIVELGNHATTYMRLARGADFLQLFDLFSHPDQAKEYEAKARAFAGLDASKRTPDQWKLLDQYHSVRAALGELTKSQEIQAEENAEADPAKKQELELDRFNREQQRKEMDLYLAINPDKTIDPDNRWVGLGQTVLDLGRGGSVPVTATAFLGVLKDYRDNRPADFNKDLAAYRQTLQQLDPSKPATNLFETLYNPIDRFTLRSSFEVFFNRFDPFTICIVLYIIVFLLVCAYSLAGRRDEMARMIYGVVCFAMLFSFVGTILGGIWADQSWGRFWGWDPKENGAVLIVLWNALILHARWGGLVRDKGIAILAVFGNIITCWSWFGTNMLGIGFHSYGFMGKALIVLSIVVILHLVLMAAGFFVPRAPRGPVPVIPVSGGARAVTRAALAVLILTFLVHTVGFICRIYISGRPPVTNLYTSAVFIAWGAVALCIGLEVVFKNGIGSLAAAIVGFASLLIADQLAQRDADTLGQLQAVLATNFWLATHVVCVTLGYAATFLAGILSAVFIVGNLARRVGGSDIRVAAGQGAAR